MSNVIDLPVVTSLALDPKKVLRSAVDQDFERVVVIGVTKDGSEYLAMSSSDAYAAVWDLERAKLTILRKADE